mmetsp:Transcript_47220/g.106451  ORF Transcript_47220/g.106451 Transcript_47220/m.106451 type:complete len:83 (+) Transcript_47220:406-654(+)
MLAAAASSHALIWHLGSVGHVVARATRATRASTSTPHDAMRHNPHLDALGSEQCVTQVARLELELVEPPLFRISDEDTHGPS